MSTVSAILLAAGESRRMGITNKLALAVDGEPLLRHKVKTLLAADLVELVVVLGHEAQQAQSLLQGFDVRTVVNRDYRQGQMSSVHCGLEALRRPCDGVMICLADQPLLTVQDIDILIGAFVQRGGSIIVPTYQGRRGNPIVLSYAHRTQILGGGRNLGCKRLIERNPELVTTVEMDNDHVVFDLDTPEDYATLQSRLKASPARSAVM
ncbi:MAG: nucleotidyltransferase family protein [Gammaproteobacteria bacterium]